MPDMFTNTRIFFIPYFIFLPLAFYFFGSHIDSADFIQYVSLSKKYLGLPFSEAANNFWSPLLCWLLIPFHFLSDDFLLSFKILQSIFICVAYLQLIQLSAVLLSSFKTRFYFLFFSLLVLFEYGFLCASPDLLYLVILLCIARMSVKQDWNYSNALVFGALGALLYFSKSFGFVFFIGFCFFLFVFRKKFSAISISKLLIAIGVFTALCTPFIATLSLQSGKFMFSGASEYNFRILSEKMNPDIFGDIKHPISFEHVQAPPDKFAVSAWQDPLTMNIPGPNFQLAYHIDLLQRNVMSVGYYYFSVNTGLLLAGIFILAVFIFKVKIRSLPPPMFPLALISFFSTALYCLVLTQKRYLIFNEILILALIAIFIEKFPNRYITISLVICLVPSFFFSYKNIKKDCLSGYSANWNKNEIAGFLKGDPKPVHCISAMESGNDGYAITTILCAFSGVTNYGMINPDNYKAWQTRLEQYGVKYFVAAGNNTIKKENYPFLTFLVYSPEINYSLYRIN